MKYDFSVYQMKNDNHIFWVAESKSLKGCVGQGETVEEAVLELRDNENEWIETAKEFGIAIPEMTISEENTYSGKFMTRISPLAHKEAAELAKQQGISLNQYVNDAIIAKNVSLTTAMFVSEATKGYLSGLKIKDKE